MNPTGFKLFEPWRYKVLKGGRGSAKSHSVAETLLLMGGRRQERILCAREIQRTIKDSVHKLLWDKIRARKEFSDFYTVTEHSIIGQNGTEFIFVGLRHNIDEIKSMEGVTVCWVEEAQKVSKESWRLLIPTIRDAGSEIWVTFNPVNETDPTDIRFVQNKPDNCLLITLNWEDNPWFSETVLAKEKDYDYSVDPETADHVWGGAYLKHGQAQIFGPMRMKDGSTKPKYIVESFECQPEWSGPYFGADWGFANDPVTLVKCWANTKVHRLYVEYEAYGVGVELNQIPALFDSIPGALLRINQKINGKVVTSLAPQQPVIRADNSRPETIVHIQGYGFNVTAAEKWPGSVEDGIAALRSFDTIVFHPRCVHGIEEARLYRYKVDPLTEDILPIVIDRHNHIWDAIRYALQPFIRMLTEELVTLRAPIVPIAPELDRDEEVAFALSGAQVWEPSSW